MCWSADRWGIIEPILSVGTPSNGTGQLTASQPAQRTDFNAPYDAHVVNSVTNSIQIARKGINGQNGTYLMGIPTLNDQYVTGSVLFVAFGVNSFMQVIVLGDNIGSATLDDQPFVSSWIPFNGVTAFQVATSSISQGHHTFSVLGPFSIEIYGSFSASASYAYLPAMNVPNFGKNIFF